MIIPTRSIKRLEPCHPIKSNRQYKSNFWNCNKIKQISLSWINRHSKRVQIRVRHFIDSLNCFFCSNLNCAGLKCVCARMAKGYRNAHWFPSQTDRRCLLSWFRETKTLQGNPILIMIVFRMRRIEENESEIYLSYPDSASTTFNRGFLKSFLCFGSQLQAHVTCGPILSNRCI